MTQPLPFPETLCAAVEEVIHQNTALGYTPKRFIQATSGGYLDGGEPELREVCSKLIRSGEALQWVEKSLQTYPRLLLLEDLVARHGERYELSEDVIEVAKASAEHLDNRVGRQRFQ